jgi:hypothetical protein
LHKDEKCHLCAEDKFEVNGQCSDCPAKQMMSEGACVCAEGMKEDGSCYLCKEVNMVFDKENKECKKPQSE